MAGKVAAAGEADDVEAAFEVVAVSRPRAARTPLPAALRYAPAVPLDSTFIIVGGNVKAGYTDKVLRYTAEGDWEEVPHLRLGQAKSGATAMTFSSSLFS